MAATNRNSLLLAFAFAVLQLSACAQDAAQPSLRGSVADEGSRRVEATQALVESSAAGGACHSGFVGKLQAKAPQCIDACPASCAALGSAITAYIMRGGQSAAKAEVCKNSWAFKCYVEGGHKQFCQSLIDQAASMGFHLPGSPGELDQECQSLMAEEAPAEAAETAAEGTPSAKAGEEEISQATVSELYP